MRWCIRCEHMYNVSLIEFSSLWLVGANLRTIVGFGMCLQLLVGRERPDALRILASIRLCPERTVSFCSVRTKLMVFCERLRASTFWALVTGQRHSGWMDKNLRWKVWPLHAIQCAISSAELSRSALYILPCHRWMAGMFLVSEFVGERADGFRAGNIYHTLHTCMDAGKSLRKIILDFAMTYFACVRTPMFN